MCYILLNKYNFYILLNKYNFYILLNKYKRGEEPKALHLYFKK